MTDALETLFMEFPADVRMTIVSALQGAVALDGVFTAAADAADVLTRLGFPESRATAEQVAAGRAARQ